MVAREPELRKDVQVWESVRHTVRCQPWMGVPQEVCVQGLERRGHAWQGSDRRQSPGRKAVSQTTWAPPRASTCVENQLIRFHGKPCGIFILSSAEFMTYLERFNLLVILFSCPCI